MPKVPQQSLIWVQRDSTAHRPGTAFVGDITCIRTWNGFIHLASVIDCSAKKVVGASVDDACALP
jgi:transposase InsO family protein